jgi:uncharacterized membrane-anchored protein
MLNLARASALCIAVAVAFGILAPSAFAQNAPPKPMTQEQLQKEAMESWKAGFRAAVIGPSSTPLSAQGNLQVPDKIAFIPMPQAGRIMRALGNSVSPNLIGLVTSVDDNEDWFATISYLPEGYIRDDDAKEWDADELLQNLREGTEHGNKDRKARGFPELEIEGWIEKPTYASADHKLVWSAALKDKGAPAGDDKTVNYNTYVLGREGYLGLNFVTTGSLIEGQKPLVRTLLSGLQFVPGKRYEEFNSSTDKVATYGLAALVGGAVLKKAGLFAVIAAFFAKFAKVGIFMVIALFGGLFKFFRRKPGSGA